MVLKDCFIRVIKGILSGEKWKGPHPNPLPEGEGGRKGEILESFFIEL